MSDVSFLILCSAVDITDSTEEVSINGKTRVTEAIGLNMVVVVTAALAHRMMTINKLVRYDSELLSPALLNSILLILIYVSLKMCFSINFITSFAQ